MAERPNAANRPVAKRPLADTNSVVSKPAAESGMKSLLVSLFVFARIFFPKSEGSPWTLLSAHSPTGVLQALALQAPLLGGEH